MEYGKDTSEYGPGVLITLSPLDMARAIDIYLISQGVIVQGPRSPRCDGDLLKEHTLYVDPSGSVIDNGVEFSGRGPSHTEGPDTNVAHIARLEASYRKQAVDIDAAGKCTAPSFAFWMCCPEHRRLGMANARMEDLAVLLGVESQGAPLSPRWWYDAGRLDLAREIWTGDPRFPFPGEEPDEDVYT